MGLNSTSGAYKLGKVYILIFNQYLQFRNRGICTNLRYTNKQIKESRYNRLDYNYVVIT